MLKTKYKKLEQDALALSRRNVELERMYTKARDTAKELEVCALKYQQANRGLQKGLKRLSRKNKRIQDENQKLREYIRGRNERLDRIEEAMGES